MMTNAQSIMEKQPLGLFSTKVLAADIAVSNMDEVTDLIILTAAAAFPSYVCISNVHMVVMAKNDERLKAAMTGSMLNTSDGMPLVWELKRQGFGEAERVSGPDLMMELCDRAQTEQLPVYFYGGFPDGVSTIRRRLVDRFPNLVVAGIESPPMLPAKPGLDTEVAARITDSGARIVFVGLGCPKQELWMHAYSPHIPAVLIGVGAAFDFLAGTVKRAPFWMQKAGLEWFYRLCSEPRRLWKRYLVTNSLFVWYWLLERFSSGDSQVGDL